MPSVNVYLTNESYLFLANKGNPSTVAKEYVEERIKKETNKQGSGRVSK